MKHKSRLLISVVLIGGLLSFFSCGSTNKEHEAQRLNDVAYRLHYRQLDSVKVYADSVLNGKDYSDEDKAEALNNLVFYYIGKMDYAVADSLARHVYDFTDNNIELLIASVQQMRICQRHSDNKNFYEYRQRALRHLQRINEEDRSILTQHQLRRLVYGESEMHIVEAAYFYYVGLDRESRAVMDTINSELVQHTDTAQYIEYLYNVGSGGYLNNGAPEEIQQQEFETLMRCYMMSIQLGYPYWQANALQAISEHLLADTQHILIYNNETAISYLNTDAVADTLLSGNLAQRAIQLFKAYGDIYQTSASWRTLSNCYFQIGDYSGAVYCLQQALSNKRIEQAPSLLASIHEDMQIAFAGIGDKVQSDIHRNSYLDLQEETRQDRHLEARAEELQMSLRTMNILVTIIVCVIMVLVLVLIILITRRFVSKRKGIQYGSTIQNFRRIHDRHMIEFDDLQEELEEQIGVTSLRLEHQQEAYEEHRAKMSLIDSLTPLIDRMLHEIKMLDGSSSELQQMRSEYIVELTDKINQENNFLTHWIQLSQGEVALHIETFPLDDVFGIIRQSEATFRMAGISLHIPDSSQRSDSDGSSILIKSDKILTLFMLNTLCDNARKFTPRGGTITIDAQELENDMIELSVTDTGKGMSQEQMDNIFVNKPITDQKFLLKASGKAERGVWSEERGVRGHGFGLLNCKGIIEKYKKTSPLFKNSTIGVESKLGEGTRVFFRLPKGVKRFIFLVLCSLSCFGSFAGNLQPETTNQESIYALADSVYQSNVQRAYERTMYYAEKCIHELNALRPTRTDSIVLMDYSGYTPAEIQWLRDSVKMPYDAILTLRNEVAVASLALHEWQLYSYNNKVYTQLFRDLSQDHSLDDYCQRMQQTESDHTVAVMLLVILLLAFGPIYYFFYYRHVISDNKTAIHKMNDDESARRDEIDALESRLSKLEFEADRLYVANNVMANSLSTIKHETMYYPSRISQIFVVDNEKQTVKNEGAEVARYYRSLYELLTEHARYNCSRQLDVPVLKDMLLGKLRRIGEVNEANEVDGFYNVYTVDIKKDNDIILHLCTQIVRDLGEQYNLRRCGIIRENDKLKVTIPNGKV